MSIQNINSNSPTQSSDSAQKSEVEQDLNASGSQDPTAVVVRRNALAMHEAVQSYYRTEQKELNKFVENSANHAQVQQVPGYDDDDSGAGHVARGAMVAAGMSVPSKAQVGHVHNAVGKSDAFQDLKQQFVDLRMGNTQVAPDPMALHQQVTGILAQAGLGVPTNAQAAPGRPVLATTDANQTPQTTPTPAAGQSASASVSAQPPPRRTASTSDAQPSQNSSGTQANLAQPRMRDVLLQSSGQSNNASGSGSGSDGGSSSSGQQGAQAPTQQGDALGSTSNSTQTPGAASQPSGGANAPPKQPVVLASDSPLANEINEDNQKNAVSSAASTYAPDPAPKGPLTAVNTASTDATPNGKMPYQVDTAGGSVTAMVFLVMVNAEQEYNKTKKLYINQIQMFNNMTDALNKYTQNELMPAQEKQDAQTKGMNSSDASQAQVAVNTLNGDIDTDHGFTDASGNQTLAFTTSQHMLSSTGLSNEIQQMQQYHTSISNKQSQASSNFQAADNQATSGWNILTNVLKAYNDTVSGITRNIS